MIARLYHGVSQLDTSPITGESKLKEVNKNEEILSGCINVTGALTCIVEREYKDSTASQIIDLVKEATKNKGKTEKFITKFSKIYTPIVISLAIFIAVVPIMLGQDFKSWIMRALIFLVASCPCSLVISVPLSFFSCIGAISKKGMIIKGTKHIESLATADTIAFDKTGTLTTGNMLIDKIETLNGFNKDLLIKYIYNLEKLSNHPISTAIKNFSNKIEDIEVKEYKEVAGHGIFGKIEENEVLFGNKKLLEKYNINTKDYIEGAIYLCVNLKKVGYIILKENIRSEALEIENKMKEVNIQNIIMLTGDNKNAAKKVAEKLRIKEFYSELLPQDKLNKIKSLKESGKKVIFVGDGINDSPVLATADFGISMGEGAEIANNTADGILISNNISTIPEIIKISRKSMGIIKFNIMFSILVKIIVLVLGVIGIAPIWLAILADTGVTLLTVINSVRIFKK